MLIGYLTTIERYDLNSNKITPILTMDIGDFHGMDVDQHESLLFFIDWDLKTIYRKNYTTRDEAAALKQNVWG